jgi:hypothetical protein
MLRRKGHDGQGTIVLRIHGTLEVLNEFRRK